ncbi:hypothetical protein N2152v2_004218 [Parachlorella kessleri]
MVQYPNPSQPLDSLISLLPKAELHAHVEGTLEAELMWKLAQRNGVTLPWPDLAAAKAARHNYSCLEDFLNTYFVGSSVLITEQDFYELADAYLEKAAKESVRHVELFFDPQAHVRRGVAWDVFLPGLQRAVEEAPARHSMTASLIMCFLRDEGPEAAAETLQQAAPYLSSISGVGLDSSEVGNPPTLFTKVFDDARQLGLHRVAHAGEEAGPDYVWEALRSLQVERIDHGVHSLEDPALLAHLRHTQIALTTCPLSNLCLQVYAGELEERYCQLLRSGLAITVNSDDPAYFGGYINDNYAYVAKVAELTPSQLADLAKASFRASFIPEGQKQQLIEEVDAVLEAWQAGRLKA